jgi:hypothetical protein
LIHWSNAYFVLSFDKTYSRDVITSPTFDAQTQKISLDQQPEILMKIKSPEDKLGIVTAHLTYEFMSEKKNASDEPPQELIFQIKESGAKEWYATSTYKPNEIGDSKTHPFGFPMIEQAKDKEFYVRLALANTQSKENVYLNIDNGVVLHSVNQTNKKELLTHPAKLLNLLLQRFSNVATNSEAQMVVLQMVPFIAFLILLNVGKI